MKGNFFFSVGIAVAVGMLLMVGVVPNIQTRRIKDNAQIVEHLEKARRLMEQYDVQMSVEGDYRTLLGAEASALDSSKLQELIENPDYQISDTVNALMQEYSHLEAISQIPQAETELLALRYGATNASQHASPQPPGSFNAAMVTQASQEYDKRLQANAKYMDDAKGQVQAALAIVPTHSSANRMKGMTEYQEALAKLRKVSLMRSELSAMRLELKKNTILRQQALKDREQATLANMDAQIGPAQESEKQAVAVVEQQQKVVEQLQQTVAQLDKRVADATSRADAARDAMEALEAAGVDLSNPNGFEEFKQAYQKQAEDYRAAQMEAQVLKYGTLQNVTIDYTGDFLKGHYEPIDPKTGIQFERGLLHYQQDLAAAQAEHERLKEVATVAEENVHFAANLKENLERQSAIAAELTQKLGQQLQEEYSALKNFEASMRTEEDAALAIVKQASASFQTAIGGVDAEEQEASATKPPQRVENHYSKVAGDQSWLKGQIMAQQSDCELLTAMASISRYLDAQADIRDLTNLSDVVDVTADATAWQETVKNEKTAALDQIQSAITRLEDRAKGSIGPGNWIIAAQIGSAYYMQSLVDADLAAEKAAEWYRLALDGQQDKEFARDHVFMRDYILAHTTKPAAETPPQ